MFSLMIFYSVKMEQWLIVKTDKTSYPWSWDIIATFSSEEEAFQWKNSHDGYALNQMDYFIVPVEEDE